MIFKPLAAVAIAFALLASFAQPSAALPLSAQEFKLWKDYTNALSDERVQKLPEERRLPAIAQNFRVKEAELRAAVEKGEQHGATIGQQAEAKIRALLDASDLKGRLRDLSVDDRASSLVVYVSWTNLDGPKLEEEASLAALLSAQGAAIASTISLSALNTSGQPVFSAKIAASSASKFQENRLKMFAATRYIRLFEDVRNAYKGTPPEPQQEQANAAPTPAASEEG